LLNPLVCLADGHQGVWNLIEEFGTDQQRWEILDWYHLKENLYKVGGSLKRLRKAEVLLWQGQVLEAKALFSGCRGKQARNFCAYLEKHKVRIVNYSYYQAEQLCSIGSGAVESAIKQIGARIKIEAGTVERRECKSGAFKSLCLPQWFTRYLVFLPNWDAPTTSNSVFLLIPIS
jgi:hypothetical protein